MKNITTDVLGRVFCIVFRNNRQSGDIHTWIFDNEDVYAEHLRNLTGIEHIDVISKEPAKYKIN